MIWSFRERSFLTSATFMWKLCLIRDVINTCDDTIHNLSAYVCDWFLDAHKIMHLILSLKSDVTCSGHHLQIHVYFWISCLLSMRYAQTFFFSSITILFILFFLFLLQNRSGRRIRHNQVNWTRHTLYE